VAKSSKRPNIREYSNGYRPVHHQKSISQFQEKHGSVPRVEERRLAEKRNASFLFNLAMPKFSICLTVVDRCDKMKIVVVWRRNRNITRPCLKNKSCTKE
jgi:hypothetical protein